jgi:hypothetical protein
MQSFRRGQIRQEIKATVGRSLRQKPQIQPVKLHQSALTCDGDGFHAAENVQLREDVRRGLGDEEVRTDFLVALATREQGQHCQFPAGQGFAAHACCQLFNRACRECREPPYESGICAPPSHGTWLEPFRPACPSCKVTATMETSRIAPKIGLKAASF